MMRGMLVVYGTLLVALCSALLAGCGGGASSQAKGDTTTDARDDADLDVPDGPERASGIVVRVSGTEGIPYLGFYGTAAEQEEDLEEVQDVVEAEPTDYEVEVPPVEAVATIFAEFEKTEPGQGELKVQILGDDKVVQEDRTLARLGRADVMWDSSENQVGPPPGGYPPEIETTEAVFFEQPEDEVEVTPGK
jgi:hypothetical protein